MNALPARLLCCAAAALALLTPAAAQLAFDLRADAEVSLSLSQEADVALDRAIRWLGTRPAPRDGMAAWMLRYAQMRPGETARLTACEVTPFTESLPPPVDADPSVPLETLLAEKPGDTRFRFALQRALAEADNPPPDWRERLLRELIVTQTVDPKTGGHWGNDTDTTVYAVLTIRALLNQSVPIRAR